MSDIVKYEQRNAVAIITLNRPDSMNAFNTELRADLNAALGSAQADDTVRVVVLTGDGR
jgi:2-(1,2-epoxy-1,2-dihydrophenyl)acetyl-CoA isomerase